jgi:hypothetical protein
MKNTPIAALLRHAAATFSLGIMLISSPAISQMTTIDPNDAISADLGTAPDISSTANVGAQTDPAPGYQAPNSDNPAPSSTTAAVPANPAATYQKDDLIGAAEGVFGKGAEGLAGLIEKILSKQGEPNAYIVGREGGGAFILGARYGSGTMFHKIEGERKAYWRGPSIGFDAGANAGSTFVLVYNLYDSEELYRRYPSAEGIAYLVGGFNASYLRRGDVVLIPIRVGVGLRLGANVGYMKFSKKQNWIPF